MMRGIVIQTASQTDAAAIQAIYAPIVANTPISFEIDMPSTDEMALRIARTLDSGHCYLVAVEQDRVCGYAYSGLHRTRAAYGTSVDVTAYVAEDYRGRGIGKALYGALFEALAATDFHMAYAGITLPNPASVALHEAVGFTHLGTFREVGRKFDAWHDVGWWQRPIRLPG